MTRPTEHQIDAAFTTWLAAHDGWQRLTAAIYDGPEPIDEPLPESEQEYMDRRYEDAMTRAGLM